MACCASSGLPSWRRRQKKEQGEVEEGIEEWWPQYGTKGVVLTKSQARDLLYVSSIISILGRDVGVNNNQSEIDAES
jgi:hypothetical protein